MLNKNKNIIFVNIDVYYLYSLVGIGTWPNMYNYMIT